MKVAKNQGLFRKYHRCYDGLATRGKDLLMADEERDRAIDFVIASLAGLAVNDQSQDIQLEKLIHSGETAERRLDRCERVLKLMIRAGRRERRIRREQEERYNRSLRELLDSQTHTDSRLDAIVDIVRQNFGSGEEAI
jgi:hypothetical protein